MSLCLAQTAQPSFSPGLKDYSPIQDPPHITPPVFHPHPLPKTAIHPHRPSWRPYSHRASSLRDKRDFNKWACCLRHDRCWLFPHMQTRVSSCEWAVCAVDSWLLGGGAHNEPLVMISYEYDPAFPSLNGDSVLLRERVCDTVTNIWLYSNVTQRTVLFKLNNVEYR